MPLGLGKVVIFEYIEVALGLLVVNDIGYWCCRFCVKEESLEGAKSSVGVDCQRDEDHVACEEFADFCVTNCNVVSVLHVGLHGHNPRCG
jgi:hypothetical protein